jgi:hypothetical protein
MWRPKESTTSLMELIPEFFVLPAQWLLARKLEDPFPADMRLLRKFQCNGIYNQQYSRE